MAELTLNNISDSQKTRIQDTAQAFGYLMALKIAPERPPDYFEATQNGWVLSLMEFWNTHCGFRCSIYGNREQQGNMVYHALRLCGVDLRQYDVINIDVVRLIQQGYDMGWLLYLGDETPPRWAQVALALSN